MKRLLILLILSSLYLTSISHPWKPDYYVIIDTDCGIDDYRAINMLLASTSVQVLAIISSDGVVNAMDGYNKINGLLQDCYKEGLLTGANISGENIAKNCKPALDFSWNDDINKNIEAPSHIEIITSVLNQTNQKIKFISLGSLSTVSDCYKKIPSFSERIEQIIWTCDYNNISESFNYQIDSNAYKKLTEKDIKLDIVNGHIPNFTFSDILLNCFNRSKILYTQNFVRSITKPNTPFSKNIYDENGVLFLHFPNLYEKTSSKGNIQYFTIHNKQNTFQLCDSINKILNGKTALSNQVFIDFPLNDNIYIDDVNEIKAETIQKYGLQEWSACVITNELHRHIGAYSIVGAKMGIRAMEYFGTGPDQMRIVTYAGIKPPFSCLNDGIQVSTGGTLGHGLIRIENDSLKLPKADFIYMNRKITLTLKEEFKKEIEQEIKDLVVIHGIDSNIYWDLVRSLAISYWANWDRHEIFEIKISN
jgi:formylmethanofuran dehydrogenase subunit E